MKVIKRSVFTFVIMLFAAVTPAYSVQTFPCNDPPTLHCCEFEATCDGDYYSRVSQCSIQCYEFIGGGQVTPSGSAQCGLPIACG
jgi:hypothetical protein